MAFSKKTWKDRISQYINRRLLTDSDGNTQQVTVTRDEGSVTEAGDAFSAANMNDLEDRIDAAFDGLTAADIPYSQGVSVANKLDSLSTVETGTFTPSTNVTVLRSSLYKLGNIKFLSIIFRFTGTVTTLGTVSAGFEATYNIDFTARSDSNDSARFRIQEDSNLVDVSTTPQTNTYYAFTISYI